MNTKLIITGCLISASLGFGLMTPSYAGFQEHYTLAQQHFFNARYSSAIDEFKKSLMINFMDNSARIGLVNSYIARGSYIANYEHNYRAAADDFRSAIFYLKYYVDKDQAMNSFSSISSTANSLHYCEKQYGANTSAEGHYKLAEELNAAGNFSASMYEYEQIINVDKYRKVSLLRIASMMKSINNLIKSAEYYKMAIEYDPSDISARMRYANVLDKMGNNEGASEQYNYVLSHCDNSDDILFDLERIFQKKLEVSPNNAELLADLGAIKQRQGKYEEAYSYYKQSLAKPARDEKTTLNTQINIGTLLQAQENYDKAIETYKNILILKPNNYLVNLYLAQCYEARKETQKLAIEQYRKLQLLKPENNEEYVNKIAELKKSSMTAEDIYNYVRSYNNPEKSYVDDLYNYAYEAHNKKDFPTAIKYYSLVKETDPSRESVYENLALCYAQQDDYKKSKEFLTEGLAKFPNNQSMAKMLKNINADIDAEIMDNAYKAYNSQNYKKAIELYSSLPESVDTILGIAGAYQGLKQEDKALECYLKAFQLSPNNSDIAYSIGAIYANEQKYEEAKKYFQKSAQLNPSNTMAKEGVADMNDVLSQNNVLEAVKLFDAKKYDQALTLLDTAISQNAANPDAYFYRASIYDAQNKAQLAIDNYKKSLEYNKNQDVTYYLIAIDYENLNKPKDALGYYKKFLEVYKNDDEYSQYVKGRIPEIEAELTPNK
ncbi:MAG: tetratricopeptide repeat protein [Cyanobacteria bacterium RUI128]|nr:tetratricopeptide repeat protein [Cyanobacteria bacterium RUI128]